MSIGPKIPLDGPSAILPDFGAYPGYGFCKVIFSDVILGLKTKTEGFSRWVSKVAGYLLIVIFSANLNLYYMKVNDVLISASEVSTIVILAVSIFLLIRKNKDLLRLWIAYDIAKLTGDKGKALQAAKEFYKRKKGKLTIYDEQIIANDLNNLK